MSLQLEKILAKRLSRISCISTEMFIQASPEWTAPWDKGLTEQGVFGGKDYGHDN